MESKKSCSDPAHHEQHICVLHNKGLYDEAMLRTDHPTVACAICLVNANDEASVCSPTTLGGGFPYSEVYERKQSVVEGGLPDRADEEQK